MVSTLDLSDPIDVVILLLGLVLLLKRVADMERYHAMRVAVLTTILSCVAIYFFLVYGMSLGNLSHCDYIDFEHYCRY